MKPPGIMATRQALVGKQVELLRDVRTRGGTKFLAGEMLRVNSVCRGRTPLSCSAADGRRIRISEWDVRAAL